MQKEVSINAYSETSKFNLDEFSTSYIRPVRDIPSLNTNETQGYVDPDKLKRIDILEVIRSIEN